jgi:hypothetical protein
MIKNLGGYATKVYVSTDCTGGYTSNFIYPYGECYGGDGFSHYYYCSSTSSVSPSYSPTVIPTALPSPVPTFQPSLNPTASPTSSCPFGDSELSTEERRIFHLNSASRRQTLNPNLFILSTNISVVFTMDNGTNPMAWLNNTFSGKDATNPWKALDNDILPNLDGERTNSFTSASRRRLLDTPCDDYAFYCSDKVITAAAKFRFIGG